LTISRFAEADGEVYSHKISNQMYGNIGKLILQYKLKNYTKVQITFPDRPSREEALKATLNSGLDIDSLRPSDLEVWLLKEREKVNLKLLSDLYLYLSRKGTENSAKPLESIKLIGSIQTTNLPSGENVEIAKPEQNVKPTLKVDKHGDVSKQSSGFDVLTDRTKMKIFYPDYNLLTALAIIGKIPTAWNNYNYDGGQWGPGQIAKFQSLTPATIGRYLKAIQKAGITHVEYEGELIPLP
jgi:hypothetical protein